MPRRYNVVFDEGAHADLADIKAYLTSVRDEVFAENFVTRIVRHCQSFRTIPHRGSRLDIDDVSLRIVSWRRNVTIGFQVMDDAKHVVVLGVFYRGRDVKAVLRERFED